MENVAVVLTVIIVAIIAWFAISKVDRPTALDADTVVVDRDAVEAGEANGSGRR